MFPSITTFHQAFRSIRDEILPIYYDARKEIVMKENKTPVTQADLISQEIIIRFLEPLGYPIIAEEEKQTGQKRQRGQRRQREYERFWVVDPLDGTSDFIKGTDEFSIMVGFVEKGKPVFGIVYQPTADTIYIAEKAKGTYKKIGDKEAIQLRLSKAIPAALKAVVSRSHFLESDQTLMNTLEITNKIHCGSVGLKIGLLCEGKADVYINTSSHTSIWDSCAPHIILEEAGGKMTDLYGDALMYSPEQLRNLSGILAANEVVYELLNSKLKSQNSKV